MEPKIELSGYDYVVHKETGETCYRITEGTFKGVIYNIWILQFLMLIQMRQKQYP